MPDVAPILSRLALGAVLCLTPSLAFGQPTGNEVFVGAEPAPEVELRPSLLVRRMPGTRSYLVGAGVAAVGVLPILTLVNFGRPISGMGAGGALGSLVALGLGGLAVVGGVTTMAYAPLLNGVAFSKSGVRRTPIPGILGAASFTFGATAFVWSLADDGVVGWAPLIFLAAGPALGGLQLLSDGEAARRNRPRRSVSVLPVVTSRRAALEVVGRF
ncbi:MAG: hypothetical protein KC912_22365 [Proteobacteria bacterium]|nr:hypothetical protein [Pseudomonadota bacterium]